MLKEHVIRFKSCQARLYLLPSEFSPYLQKWRLICLR